MNNDILCPEIITYAAGPKRPPVELLAGAWLAGYSSPAARRACRSDLHAWLRFCETHGIAPFEARRSHVELFARGIEQRGCKAATVAHRLCGISRWYGWLVDEEYLDASPAAPGEAPASVHGVHPKLAWAA